MVLGGRVVVGSNGGNFDSGGGSIFDGEKIEYLDVLKMDAFEFLELDILRP